MPDQDGSCVLASLETGAAGLSVCVESALRSTRPALAPATTGDFDIWKSRCVRVSGANPGRGRTLFGGLSESSPLSQWRGDRSNSDSSLQRCENVGCKWANGGRPDR